jgi:hypothetical protein
MNIFLNKPHVTKDVLVFEGDTYVFNLVLFEDCDDTSLPLDTTDWVFELVVRDRFNNIVVSYNALGTISGVDLALTDIDTTQYPSDSYRYSIRYISTSTPVVIKTIMRGRFIIKNNEHI